MSTRPITTNTAKPMQPTTNLVAEIVRQVTGIKNVPLHEPFSNLGVTSPQAATNTNSPAAHI